MDPDLSASRTPSALKPDTFELRRGTLADVSFIMTTERLPGYESLVGRWSEEQHRAALADSRYVYFVAEIEARKVGFVLVRDWDSPEHITLIKRIAVAEPGKGHGKLLLAHLVDRIFRDTGVYRICLGLYPDNTRARRVYERVGFKAEGVSRGSAFFGGVHRDELMMALLRPEWPPDRLQKFRLDAK
jgi:RimJ/RimL family protein N-acetyltransferase